MRERVGQWANERGKSVRVFERSEDGEVAASKEFGLGRLSSVLGKVRSNVSVISTLAQFDHKPSLLMQEMPRTVISNILIEREDPTDDWVIRNVYAPNTAVTEAL